MNEDWEELNIVLSSVPKQLDFINGYLQRRKKHLEWEKDS